MLDLDKDPVPGDPERVKKLARELHDFAEDVGTALRQIKNMASEDAVQKWSGKSAKKFKEQFDGVPGNLKKLRTSYDLAGDAIAAYWPKLERAQTLSNRALAKGREARQDLTAAQGRLDTAQDWVKTATAKTKEYDTAKGADKPDEAQVRAATRKAHDATTARNNAQGAVDTAQNALDAAKAMAQEAKEIREEAARICKDKLEDASDAGIQNRSWWEEGLDFVSDNWDAIVTVCKVIVAVVGIIAMIVGGPILAAIVVVAAIIVLADTLTKYANGQATLWDVGLAALDCIPGLKGLTTLAGAAKGLKGAAKALRAGGLRGALRSGKDLLKKAKPAAGRCKGGDPIDMVSGEMLMEATDLVLPGELPLVLERTHLSTYRWGRYFGESWASTLDQRVELDGEGAIFATEDGMVLAYPVPAAGQPVTPLAGPRWPLEWDGEPDSPVSIFDPRSGITRKFATPGSSREEGDRADAPERLILLPQSITDRNGNEITFEYDAAGMPMAVRHTGGYHIAVDTADDRIIGLRLLSSDELPDSAHIVRYSYNDDGNVSEIYNSSGMPFQLAYDDNARITSWTDRNDAWYRFSYDDEDRCIRGEGVGGILGCSISYDTDQRITRYTDSLGHTTTFEYNDAYRLIRETDALGHTRFQEWDDDGRLVATTDALGSTTRVQYDAAGLMTSIIGPDGLESASAYDDAGRPIVIAGTDGAAWHQEFDGYGNRTAVTDPTGATARFTYTANGLLDSVTDALGQTTEFRYNQAGLPVEVIDSLGAVTRYDYNAMGRQSTVTDPLGNTTRLEWTTEGQLSCRTYPDGTNESWSYDAEGNCTTHTDPSGGVTRYESRGFDSITGRTTPDGARFTFAHDTELRLTRVTNPQGLTWRYTYDAAGRLISETDFDDRTLTYSYDAADRFVSRTTPLGQLIKHDLDPAGRILAKDVDGKRTTYAYNSAGYLTRAAAPTSALELSYDSAGRVLSETVDGRTTRFGFDAIGRRTHRTTPSGVHTEMAIDAVGRPTTMSLGGHRLDFDRDALGRETTRTFGVSSAPLSLSTTWDARGRRVRQQLDIPGRTLHSRSYGYRADDNLVETVDQVTGQQRSMELDSVGRPLQVSADGWTESYAYDAAGNQTAAHWPDAAPHPESRGERSYSGTRIRSAGAVRYEHDRAGRTILRQKTRLSRKPDTWRYEYDAEDQLVACVTPDGTLWRYSYDPLGRRSAKHRIGSDGETIEQTIYFTWDGTNLAEQVDTATNVVTTWEYDDDEHPLAQLECRSRNGELSQNEVDRRFFAIITDLVGAPTELVGESGEVAWRTRTTMWGTTAWNRDASAYTPLRFPGQYADLETGLHYNFLRHYDPETARYTSPDPFGLAPAPNPVAYTTNPQTWSDPLGLVPKSCLQDKYKWDGSVRFGKLDDLGRPTGVWASLRREMLDKGTEAGSTRTPGWRGNGTDFNEARGHLLANRLGGPGKGPLARHNLVTLTQNPTNTPVMKAIEARVYNAVKGDTANGIPGQNVQYSVKPIYEGTNPIPIQLEISAFGDRGFQLTDVLDNPAAGVRTAVT
ncbi:RHS repeat-associated core domain-containing protein [Streptomyces boninensis]|uniref:RHS repeat-associated core domain-containing protein n=1 Tax=Streptomyces boninensis TaxID=2039455 RepID=UPI003B2176DD